jgi:iron complex outermembrane receptor protein
VLPEKNHFEFSIGVNGMKQNSQDKGVVFVIPEYDLMDIGGFAIAKKTFKKLSINAGLRYDMRTMHGKEMWVDSAGVRLAGQVDAASWQQFTAYTSNFSGLSGSLGSAYDFNDNVYTKFNLSRGYRAPSVPESGSNGIHDGTPFYEIGDHNLKSESSIQGDFTLGINTEDFTLETNVFYNHIQNYIFAEKLASVFGGDSIRTDVAAGLMSGPAFKYVQGDAVLTGGEAIFDLHPHTLKAFHWNNSFGMVDAIQLNQPDSTKYLPYTPPYKYHGELRFEMAKQAAFLKNAYIKFGMDYFFEQNKFYKKFGNETVTPEYTLFNVGVGTDICSKKTTLCSIYINVNNITDVAYQSSMSRLKYADPNNATGRIGVYNMGRNISFKLIIPIGIKK